MINRYPILLPLLFMLLMGGIVVSLIAAFATGEWRYLLITGVCYAIIAQK